MACAGWKTVSATVTGAALSMSTRQASEWKSRSRAKRWVCCVSVLTLCTKRIHLWKLVNAEVPKTPHTSCSYMCTPTCTQTVHISTIKHVKEGLEDLPRQLLQGLENTTGMNLASAPSLPQVLRINMHETLSHHACLLVHLHVFRQSFFHQMLTVVYTCLSVQSFTHSFSVMHQMQQMQQMAKEAAAVEPKEAGSDSSVRVGASMGVSICLRVYPVEQQTDEGSSPNAHHTHTHTPALNLHIHTHTHTKLTPSRTHPRVAALPTQRCSTHPPLLSANHLQRGPVTTWETPNPATQNRALHTAPTPLVKQPTKPRRAWR